MELRPRGTRHPIKGDSSQYIESSDEDDLHVVISDSDYDDISDAAQDLLSTVGLNRGERGLDSDHDAEDEVELSTGKGFVSDSDLEDKVPKRRKVSQKKKLRGKSCKEEELKEVKEDVVAGSYYESLEGHQVVIDNFLVERVKDERRKMRRKGVNKPILMWEIWEVQLKDWVEENMTEDTDIDTQNDVVADTAEAPSDLIIPLLRYQKEWLAWALKQEESVARGGILADEMGMGKTVQAIALVLAKRELNQGICESSGVISSPSSSTCFPEIKATLVVCPLVAVIQWVNEIDRFTTKGSNKVLVYHGANRGKTLHQFSEYDFVITTYSIVEAEYRKYVMPPKHKCEWCGKLFYESKIATHLKYFCGPYAVRTSKQSKQRRKGQDLGLTTSKKKTSANDKASESEDGKNKETNKKKRKHYSKGKEFGISSTENLSGVEHGLHTSKSTLHSVKWNRIVLDEAHYIKERRGNTTRAVLALESSYKWALSGTPLQNRVGELYSLVRFLQISPYSYYLCKDCNCRTLDYSSNTDCPKCPHKSVRHFCWWNKYIASPIQYHGNENDGKKAMILLKHKILKRILLRRTKKGRAADLALPPRILSLRRDYLDVHEEDYYTSLYNESQAQFNTYVTEGTVMNNYAHIFDLLTRLRQAVDHPYLVVYSSSAIGKSASMDTNNGEQVCGLCHDPVEDPVVTSCAHVFCKSCLIDFSASVGQVSCPCCSKPLTVDFSTNKDAGETSQKTLKGFKRSSILNRIRLDDFQTSTKIDALREEIRFMIERDGSAKGIVFSQFTSFLDLIHYSLQKSGVNCVQLVGSMSMGQRDAAIKKFTEDPDCRIFLMSLKAGGVALNLTVASHVFLMDPWWNPAVERQAQDRIHRIGQYKPIRIVRFVIENTIEERILKLQEKKELVFEGTVGGSSDALGKLTADDMRFLFVT